MPKEKELALTYEEAILKYFGDILHSETYPWPCICGNFWLMHLDEGWVDHVREKHGERIVSPEQKERALKKRQEKNK